MNRKEIIIKRDKQFVSGISKMKIYINNEFVGYIKNGDEKSFFYDLENLDLKIKYLWIFTKINIKNSSDIIVTNVKFNMSDRVFIMFGIIINALSVCSLITKSKFLLFLTLAVTGYFVFLLLFKKNRIVLKHDSKY